ncbi:hypothetical protein DCC77_02825 [Candidatus Uhrbacteria bacterium]|nr:MAG: hypothetical protein DCC77_02825 [Candidatus Uhrbacteria bacterium]
MEVVVSKVYRALGDIASTRRSKQERGGLMRTLVLSGMKGINFPDQYPRAERKKTPYSPL